MTDFATDKGFGGATDPAAQIARQRAASFFQVTPGAIDPVLIALVDAAPGGGYWRTDLDTGLFYWTPETFALFDMPASDGPLDFAAQIGLYHPDDRRTLLDLIDRIAEDRCGYSFNLRIRPSREERADRYVYIRSEARFHEDGKGRRILGAVGLSDDDVCFAHLVR